MLAHRIVGLQKQSRLMVAVICGFILLYLASAFVLVYASLRYLNTHFPLVGVMVIERLLFVLFGFLFLMLIMSNAIIAFVTLFRNRETEWLLNQPLPHRDIFRWKCMETCLLASWPFLFLILPLLPAYSLVFGGGLLFNALLLVLFIPYALIASALGISLLMGLLLIWKQLRLLLPSLLSLAALVYWSAPKAVSYQTLSDSKPIDLISQVLRDTEFLMSPLLPSHWMAQSLIMTVDGVYSHVIFNVALLVSHALMAVWLLCVFISHAFYPCWNRVQTRRATRPTASRCSPRPLTRLSDRLARGAEVFFARDTVALVLKDHKSFWRDPAQWSQFAIFFGILAIYILNLRNTRYQLDTPFWAGLVAYMNLAACSMTLSTLTTRFVFPQFSLEGRRLWLVGLTPLGLRGVVLVKFYSSWFGTAAITVPLIFLSSYMLRQSPLQIAGFTLLILSMSAALSSVAVGLGVLYPNFKEDNPSKIVSGFGGTLCLVISSLYIITCVVCLAIPALIPLMPPLTAVIPASLQAILNLGGLILCAALTLFIIVLPLRMALERTQKMEI
ncbi:MAG: hypothetical protein SFY92_04225 [Verrucomicrobiae bacterium]|nr:hypothetical protein [Verrucomicrobiae bacterium]